MRKHQRSREAENKDAISHTDEEIIIAQNWLGGRRVGFLPSSGSSLRERPTKPLPFAGTNEGMLGQYCEMCAREYAKNLATGRDAIGMDLFE